MSYQDSIEARLVDKIVISSQTGCWLYKRRKAGDKHAIMSINFPGRSQQLFGVHRVAAWLWLGIPLDTDLEVCHSCDVKPCVNPDHLYLATHQQNVQDAADRGRFIRTGEHNGRAKLSTKQVLKIRKLYEQGVPRKEIYRLFPQVPYTHLGYIFRGDNWTEPDAMNEATLTKKMGKRIRDRGGWARKTHGGPQGAGLPDLIAVYRGYPLWLEVKMPGKEKTLTKLQDTVLTEAKAAGAVARMVTTTKQVDRIMDAIDRKKGVK